MLKLRAPKATSLRPLLARERSGQGRAELRRDGLLVLEGAAVVAGVAFVGGDEVVDAVAAEGRDAVGHVRADHARPGGDVHLSTAAAGAVDIAIAGIEGVAGETIILEAERPDRGDRTGGDVDLGDRVGLLQADVRGLRIVAHGDVLGLHVRAERGRRDARHGAPAQAASDQAGDLADAAAANVPVGEADGRHRRVGKAAAYVDDADAAVRIDGVAGRRLAFVGDQHVGPVRSEGDHVGQRADHRRAEQGQVGAAHEGDVAEVLPDRRLDADRRDAVVDRHAVRRAEHADGQGSRAFDQRADVKEILPRRRSRIGEVEDIDAAGLGVDHQDAPRRGVERRDLRGGDVVLRHAADRRLVASDALEGQPAPGVLRRRVAMREDGDDRRDDEGGGGEAEDHGGHGSSRGAKSYGPRPTSHEWAMSAWSGAVTRRGQRARIARGMSAACHSSVSDAVTIMNDPRPSIALVDVVVAPAVQALSTRPAISGPPVLPMPMQVSCSPAARAAPSGRRSE